jgi:hypothetical protein
MRSKDSASSGLKKNEEEKNYCNQMILTSRPVRSGELACDEELLLEDSCISNVPNEREDNVRMIRALFKNTQRSQGVQNLYQYFLNKNPVYEVNPNILEASCQPMLNWKMRALLLDWMIEVSSEFKLQRETFYLAMNYLDRYISKVPNIQKKNYQLIGTSSLYLASKVEEIYTPKISYFILATDNGYSLNEILVKERRLVMELEWSLTPSSIETWIQSCCSEWDKFCDTSENLLSFKNSLG